MSGHVLKEATFLMPHITCMFFFNSLLMYSPVWGLKSIWDLPFAESFKLMRWIYLFFTAVNGVFSIMLSGVKLVTSNPQSVKQRKQEHEWDVFYGYHSQILIPNAYSCFLSGA
jgi:hypothetical protein